MISVSRTKIADRKWWSCFLVLHNYRTEKGEKMKVLRLIVGILFSIGGGLQVPGNPLLGLAVTVIGGKMVLDAVAGRK